MARRLRIACALGLLAVPAHAQEPYEIGPGDLLQIVVVGQQELTGEFKVDQDGMLVLPVLGKVKAAELAPSALQKKLTTLLADGYLRRPQVSVQVKEYQSQRVYVAGELQKPGPYPLKGDRTLLTLIGEVGGLTSSVGHEVIVVRPPEGGAPPGDVAPLEAPPSGARLPGEVAGSQVFRLNLRELMSGNPAGNLELQAGDTVYFPRAAQAYVSGHVARPGAVRYDEGMTVFQAINEAGGATERGSLGKVKIVRLVDGQRKEFKAKLSDLVQPGDNIVVPERFF